MNKEQNELIKQLEDLRDNLGDIKNNATPFKIVDKKNYDELLKKIPKEKSESASIFGIRIIYEDKND